MKELDKWLNAETKWLYSSLESSTNSFERNYFYGRLDQIARFRLKLLLGEDPKREGVS